MEQSSGQAAPRDPRMSQTLTLRGFQAWGLIFLFAALSFWSAFFYKRYDHVKRQAERLHQINRELEFSERRPVASGGVSAEERARIERELRAKFEVRDAAITSELNELYDVEARIREKYELPPRVSAVDPKGDGTGKGGQGGGASVYDGELFRPTRSFPRPAHLIYGLSRPSADLIVQEIRLRGESLEELLRSMDAKEEKTRLMTRTPSIWPSVDPRARLSSRFGYRRDPFTSAVRHHDGTDISAPAGSAVIATASGTVVFTGWEDDLGKVVKISHGNNLETWYAHLQEYAVTAGQEVQRGDKIAAVGSTGRSTGYHVHYEVRINGQPVDSSAYLGN